MLKVTKFGKKTLGLCLGVGVFLGVSALSARAIEIGNYVWCDENANGIQDATEPGVNGVLVELYSCSGEFVMATNTATGPDGKDGWYLFTSPWDSYGSYYVKFHLPAGYTFTLANQGGDAALDSNPDPATGIAPCTGPHDLTQDAGLICTQSGPGTGTPGYWRNHPEAWPVEQITIGGVTYTKAQALALIAAPVAKDKRYSMFAALIATKLNLLNGTESSCIADTVTQADAWLVTYGAAPVKASSHAWSLGSPLHAQLDDYNNGLLCAPHRD